MIIARIGLDMDVYFKKEITYPLEGKKFHFELGETLFSTFNVDHGTDFLLRNLSPEIEPKRILDLGCGYGPIGIVLASKYPGAKVVMVDRDLLAIKYAKYNIEKNGISNATAIGSVGMESLANQKFDLIVSNIPAKIGDEAITQEFLLQPFSSLNLDGELWVVVVNALNRLVPKVGSQNELSLKLVQNRRGHSIYRMKKHS